MARPHNTCVHDSRHDVQINQSAPRLVPDNEDLEKHALSLTPALSETQLGVTLPPKWQHIFQSTVPTCEIEYSPYLFKGTKQSTSYAANRSKRGLWLMSQRIDQFLTRSEENQESLAADQGTNHNPDALSLNQASEKQASIQRQRLLNFDNLGQIGFISPQNSKSGNLASAGSRNAPALHQNNRTHNVTVLQYGKAESSLRFSLGQKIEAILNGNPRVSSPSTAKHPSIIPKTSHRKIHPFFEKPSRLIGEAKEPELRVQKAFDQPATVTAPEKGTRSATDTFTSTIPSTSQHTEHISLRSRKPDGSPVGVLWPSGDWVHVSDASVSPRDSSHSSVNSQNIFSRRSKGKLRTIEVGQSENVLTTIAQQLFSQPNSNNIMLPVPERHVMTGPTVQNLMSKELGISHSGTLDANNDASMEHSTMGRTVHHSAVHDMYTTLPSRLSAFDQGECSHDLWVNKYAPRDSSQVLQGKSELTILRDWLRNLRLGSSVKTKTVRVTGRKDYHGPRKKRKHNQPSREFEDFIVMSDDDMAEVQTLSDASNDDQQRHYPLNASSTHIRRSEQGVQNQGFLSNVILLTGSHGCGKTATAYAVAREMKFDVFEINSSSRRSAKDVLDRVGDLLLNHNIFLNKPTQHGHDDTPFSTLHKLATPISIDSKLPESEQGFNSSRNKDKVRSVTEDTQVPTPKVISCNSSQPTARLSQSLILLEEVDVLFEEDKQFFDAVVQLANQSRRPIIMTCTDERLLPDYTFEYHAILRFQKPPTDIATEYLLLLAAAEGHLLSRKSIEHMYVQHRMDLRSAISNLNFWCQIGLHDERGGFGWYLKRWPRGIDLDYEGNVLRVMSQDSYVSGLSDCFIEDMKAKRSVTFVIEDALIEQWPGHEEAMHGTVDLLTRYYLSSSSNLWRSHMHDSSFPQSIHVDFMFDLISALDVYYEYSSAAVNQSYDRLDTAQSNLSASRRGEYTIGYQLLDSPLKKQYQRLSTLLASATILSIATAADMDLAALMLQCESMDRTPNAGLPSLKHRASSTMLGKQQFQDAMASLSTDLEEESLSVYRQGLVNTALDLGPYIRSIVYSDCMLSLRTLADVSPTTENQAQFKRARMTRASRSALEGIDRQNMRRPQWFHENVNAQAILATGSKEWQKYLFEPTTQTL